MHSTETAETIESKARRAFVFSELAIMEIERRERLAAYIVSTFDTKTAAGKVARFTAEKLIEAGFSLPDAYAETLAEDIQAARIDAAQLTAETETFAQANP